MRIESVASSHVRAIAYDRSEHVLYVQFRNGAAYAYRDVPRGVFEQFLDAPSKGRFLHEVIRPEYGEGDKM